MSAATLASRPRVPHPYFVLAVAALLPGMGQVLNGMTTRAWIMLFFALTLGVITYQLTTPAHSFIGRHAGALFIHAIMVLDAYAWARYRRTLAASPPSGG